MANIKAELVALKEQAKDGARYKRQWEVSEAKADALQGKVAELTAALAESKTELKTLSTKLAAARTAEAAAVAKVPGSALKPGALGGSRAAAAAAGDAAMANTQAAQMKEDLYGDLTGLIVRAVKRGTEQDVYDCIQTGRNGSTSPLSRGTMLPLSHFASI